MLKCPVCEKKISPGYVVYSSLSEEYTCQKCGSILKLSFLRRAVVALSSAVFGFSIAKVFDIDLYLTLFVISIILLVLLFFFNLPNQIKIVRRGKDLNKVVNIK